MFTDVDTITGHKLLSTNGTDLNGSKAVDYDNDGDLDLYFHDNLASSGNQRLFRNDGNWQFTDVTALRGLEHVAAGGAAGRGGRVRQRLGRPRSRRRPGLDRSEQFDVWWRDADAGARVCERRVDERQSLAVRRAWSGRATTRPGWGLRCTRR